ncbi:AI-2E family transporter [Salinivibrio costicola]|uniref:AI-2E family transporter n=1 Tax=Salinivibrio costicola subsp. alcaliphilus TaxID=272773 RepID=A0ABX3KR77_SALCS|nr:AI-2E family transporter [Salinivibrio costicola]OOF34236.1 AI-2E family transporter [Salinivibrio costicola subsp. alcaliphilus]
MTPSFRVESKHWTLIAALIIAVYACYLLIEPYIGAIVLAFIVSLLFFPVHKRIEEKIGQRPNTASVLSCILITFIIFIPLTVVAGAIIDQGVSFFTRSYEWLNNGGARQLINNPQTQSALHFVNQWLPFDVIDPQETVKKLAAWMSSFSGQMLEFSSGVLGDVTNFFITFMLMLFVLFFLLRDHDNIIQTLRHVIPLSRSQEDQLLDEVEKVAKSAVLGSFLTALAQGAAGGLAMWAVGLPALFWGTMMAFASFIPVVGTALIWLPTVLYLAVIGDWQWALALLVWSVVVVGSIDNLLRPFLMQGNSGMNTLLIFFSLLGGLHLFGLMGLIYGPIIFSLTLVLFRMYELEFAHFLDRQDNA